ncbi:MAG: SdpI family protein [Nitriliruptoraceae bacterium]
MPDEAGIWIVGLVLLLAGVALLVVGRKQRAGTLRRSRLVGLRTPQTLRSDTAWYAAHEATAGLVAAAGVVQILAGTAMLALRPTADGRWRDRCDRAGDSRGDGRSGAHRWHPWRSDRSGRQGG